MNRSRGRLSRSEDFARVYRTGRSVANRYMVLYYFERTSGDSVGTAVGPRVGFSVSKRLGNAVQRNRVKRVLREAVRAHGESVKGSVDIVLIARAPLMDLLETEGYAAVDAKTQEILDKAALISARGGTGPFHEA